MKKICLITTGMPSTNPRLVKEADALQANGYEVVVLYAFWSAWALETDRRLLATKSWKAVLCGGSPLENKSIYFFTRLIQKMASALAIKTRLPFLFSRITVNRSYYFQLQKALSYKADLYIAHNLGALPVAIAAARITHTKAGFDAEDLHHGETADPLSFANLRAAFLEKKYMPRANYLTAASPVIARLYERAIPGIRLQNIYNVFPLWKEVKPLFVEKEKGLKLFWFSQTVGRDRGLEDVISAMGLLNEIPIRLTLLGEATEEIKRYLITKASDSQLRGSVIHFMNPVDPERVIALAAEHHVGLALEQRINLNRDSCLTNKIFTYLTAGLPVIATSTTAQSEFMAENEGFGAVYAPGDFRELANILNRINLEGGLLDQWRYNAKKAADTRYCWEIEQIFFLELVKNTINE